MEPLTTTTMVALKWVAGKAGEEIVEKVKERVAEYIGTRLMDRIRHRRLDSFVDQLCRELQVEEDGKYSSANLDDLFVKLDDDEGLQETLFEAYRKVALSASRDIGPRVIAMVTAPVLQDHRLFTEMEEEVIAAAESMNDRELSRFVEWMDMVTAEEEYQRLRELAASEKHGETKILLKYALWQENPVPGKIAINLRRGYDANSTDLYRELGSFAVRLVSAGLLSERIEVGEWKRKPNLREHQLLIRFGCEMLYRFAKRACLVGETFAERR
jgi:hypothetical protein